LNLINSDKSLSKHIPPCRQKFFKESFSDYSPNDYAFLLKKIIMMKKMKNLSDFRRLDTRTTIKYLRNYSIVEDL